jgi:hypothetical protein
MPYLEYHKRLKSYRTVHHARKISDVNKIQGQQGTPNNTRAFRKYLNFFVTHCHINIHYNNSNYNNNDTMPCLINWCLKCYLPGKQDCPKDKKNYFRLTGKELRKLRSKPTRFIGTRYVHIFIVPCMYRLSYEPVTIPRTVFSNLMVRWTLKKRINYHLVSSKKSLKDLSTTH